MARLLKIKVHRMTKSNCPKTKSGVGREQGDLSYGLINTIVFSFSNLLRIALIKVMSVHFNIIKHQGNAN